MPDTLNSCTVSPCCQVCTLIVAYGEFEQFGFREYPDYLDGILAINPVGDEESDWFFGTCSLCNAATHVAKMIIDPGD